MLFYQNRLPIIFLCCRVLKITFVFEWHVCLCLYEWCARQLPDWHVGPSLPWQWFKDEIQRRETIFLYPSDNRMMCSPLCFGYLTCKSFIVCCLHTISILVSTCLSTTNSSTIKSLLPSLKPCTECCLFAYISQYSIVMLFILQITMETNNVFFCWLFFYADACLKVTRVRLGNIWTDW